MSLVRDVGGCDPMKLPVADSKKLLCKFINLASSPDFSLCNIEKMGVNNLQEG